MALNWEKLEAEYLPRVDLAFHAALDSMPRTSPLREMAVYHYQTGGKRLRPLTAILAAKTVNPEISDEKILPWAVAVEMIHNATLIHDDLQDGDTMRRGQPTLWVRFSAAQAINCGDALFFLAGRILSSYEPQLRLRLQQLQQDKTLAVIEGQSQEFALKAQLARPDFRADVSEYEQMVMGKTSALFALPILGGALIAGASPKELLTAELSSRALGLLFQVQDDYIDLWGEKGRGSPGADLAEGKLSYPVIRALAAWEGEELAADRARLLRTLHFPRDATPKEDILWCIDRFASTGVKAGVEASLGELSTRVDPVGALAPAIKLVQARLQARTH